MGVSGPGKPFDGPGARSDDRIMFRPARTAALRTVAPLPPAAHRLTAPSAARAVRPPVRTADAAGRPCASPVHSAVAAAVALPPGCG